MQAYEVAERTMKSIQAYAAYKMELLRDLLENVNGPNKELTPTLKQKFLHYNMGRNLKVLSAKAENGELHVQSLITINSAIEKIAACDVRELDLPAELMDENTDPVYNLISEYREISLMDITDSNEKSDCINPADECQRLKSLLTEVRSIKINPKLNFHLYPWFSWLKILIFLILGIRIPVAFIRGILQFINCSSISDVSRFFTEKLPTVSSKNFLEILNIHAFSGEWKVDIAFASSCILVSIIIWCIIDFVWIKYNLSKKDEANNLIELIRIRNCNILGKRILRNQYLDLLMAAEDKNIKEAYFWLGDFYYSKNYSYTKKSVKRENLEQAANYYQLALPDKKAKRMLKICQNWLDASSKKK